MPSGAIITTVGLAKLASATPLNQLNISTLAVGDGNGGYPTLDPSMTALTNEVWRGTPSPPIRDPNSPNVLIFEAVIPPSVGGFTVREQAIFDDAGDMIAIGQTSVVEKPLPNDTTGVILTVRLHIQLDSAEQVDLFFQDDPTISAGNVSNANGGSVQDFIDAQYTTVAELATGKFIVGESVRLNDRANRLFLLQSGGSANGTDILDAGNGNTAVYQKTFIIDPCALGASSSPADSTEAWTRAIEIANSLPLGGEVRPSVRTTYRITDQMPQTVQGVIVNLAGSIIDADFASGWAFRIGNQSVAGLSGIINGIVMTSRPEVTLNGVLFSKNVRRLPKYDGLRVSAFKGTGVKFQELNWSVQDWISILVEKCGNNLWIDDNGNALNICAGLDEAVEYNLVLRGVFSVNVIGGYNQNAGISGILIDNGQVGSLQLSSTINVMSYFENNGQNHIIARNGVGLNVTGSYFKCTGMTGSAIKLENWTGANITGNSPTGLSAGTQRDFVETDAACTQIYTGPQYSTTATDTHVNVSSGGDNSGISNSFNNELTTLPTGSNLTKGSQVLLRQAGQSRARPWIFLTDSASNRIWREIATKDRKQTAQAAAATLTPNLNALDVYDLTLSSNLTVNAPTGEFKDGDAITFVFRNSGAGGLTITWNPAYKTSYSNTGNVANSYCTVKFIYSAGRSLWVQTDLMPWTA